MQIVLDAPGDECSCSDACKHIADEMMIYRYARDGDKNRYQQGARPVDWLAEEREGEKERPEMCYMGRRERVAVGGEESGTLSSLDEFLWTKPLKHILQHSRRESPEQMTDSNDYESTCQPIPPFRDRDHQSCAGNNKT